MLLVGGFRNTKLTIVLIHCSRQRAVPAGAVGPLPEVKFKRVHMHTKQELLSAFWAGQYASIFKTLTAWCSLLLPRTVRSYTSKDKLDFR